MNLWNGFRIAELAARTDRALLPALGGFRTPANGACDASVLPASENLHSSRHMQRSICCLFNDVVRKREQLVGNGQTERLRGL
jgi:hypothetical protein